MANMTNYLENKLIDHLLRGIPYTAPTTLYIGLFTSAPGEAGGGTEVSGGSYSRGLIASGFDKWYSSQGTLLNEVSSATGGTTSNGIDISYPTPSANWGTITSWAAF